VQKHVLTITKKYMGNNCCRKDEDGKEENVTIIEPFCLARVRDDMVMRDMCCDEDDLGKDPTEIRPVIRDLHAEILPFSFCGTDLPKKCEIMAESLERLRNRCISIAGAEMEKLNSQQAQAYADVLNRVLDVLAATMQFPAQTVACDLSDTSVLMVAVAAPEELARHVSTPQVVVLTQEPAANNVHDDRFKTMVSKLCRSLSSTVRRGSAARHIAVSRVSGEILATSAVFLPGSQKAPSRLSPTRRAYREADQKMPLNALELATTLDHGVVFAAYERGGLLLLPSMDVARERSFRLAPTVRKV